MPALVILVESGTNSHPPLPNRRSNSTLSLDYAHINSAAAAASALCAASLRPRYRRSSSVVVRNAATCTAATAAAASAAAAPRTAAVGAQPQLRSLQIVYGANSVASSEESARVMSEKVQMLASSIYKELEHLIQRNGEESVKVSSFISSFLFAKNAILL